MGRFEPEMMRFVKRYLAELRRIPTVFLAVSLAAFNAGRPCEKRAAAQTTVEKTTAAFFAQTGWTPSRIEAVAGALSYSRYGFLTRWIMKRIAGKEGLPVDTTQDYEFSDWPRLDRAIGEWMAGSPSARAATPSA